MSSDLGRLEIRDYEHAQQLAAEYVRWVREGHRAGLSGIGQVLDYFAAQSPPAREPDAWIVEDERGRTHLFGRMTERFTYCDVESLADVIAACRGIPNVRIYELIRAPHDTREAPAPKEDLTLWDAASELVDAMNAVRSDISEGAEFDVAWERISTALAAVENHPAIATREAPADGS
jgi:hypothetical protein